MKRRHFLLASAGAAAVWPARRLVAGEAPAVAVPITDLRARSLDGAELALSRPDLENLAASLRGPLLRPGDAGYDSARRLWNGLFDKRPALIVRCEGAADVLAAVQFARASGVLTAVRGGAHSATGKSACDGGLMIDLSPMSAVRVDPAARTARVGGGALLGHLDHETRPFGLVTTAGTVSHTGAGGLTLGGGFGRVGRRFGLACDNLQAADVVTAAGRLVHAGETENADLLWGLRGGGGNFGVVTSLEYRLHPMDPTVLGGVVSWPIERAREVLRFYVDWSRTTPDELNTDFFMTTPPGGPPLIAVEAVWSADHAAGERALAPLRGFGRPARDTAAPVAYVAVQRGGDNVNGWGVRHYARAGFTRGLDATVVDALVDAFATAPADLIVLLQQSGGAIGRVPADATAFVNRDAKYWMMVMANWRDPAEDDRRTASVKRAWQKLERFTSGYYVNSLASELDAKERLVYGGNHERMVALKTKYDPANLFRLNANVKPRAAQAAA